MFYVYEWFIVETGEVFYVGKGTKSRYTVKKHNKMFCEFIKRYDCDSRIIRFFDKEEEAFEYEYERINELKVIGQCVCNIYNGGFGGTVDCWTQERREWYSKHNVMKSENQRKLMKTERNPSKNPNNMEKIKAKLRRAVVINGTIYASSKYASKDIGVTEVTIREWLRKGVTSNGSECYYLDGNGVRKHTISSYPSESRYKRKVIIDGEIYESIKEASKFLNCQPTNLCFAIKRDGKYKGHTCEYANQKPSHGKSDNSTVEGSTTNG